MTETSKRRKRSKKGLWILLLILVFVGLYVGWRFYNTRQAANRVLANIETQPYRRDSLSAFIYGTGTVEPGQTAVLTWSASGIIGEVGVAVGDRVEKDQVLMSLETDSLSVEILQAQIDVINAQRALDKLYENWGVDLAQARLDLLNTEERLENLQNQRSAMNFQRCSDEKIEELEDALDKAEQAYNFQQNATNLQRVNTAQANLNFCLAEFSEREIAEAEFEIELAEARLTSLQDRVNLLTDGPDPDEVTILETRLAIAQSRLDSPKIKAPFAGVITELPAHVGDVVQMGARAVQLNNLAELQLTVKISEIDIPHVNQGQPAQLVFDAYYERTFNGTVTEISPVGSSGQGVVEYTVTIQMQDADVSIRPGMTAAVSILIQEIENVFVISNEAIVSINGQEQVFVRRGDSYVGVPVVLGFYSDYYSEVLEAEIQEGELIVLNPPAEITGVMPFNMGPGSRGFGGFRN